jgi:sugar lactone lactonase YvrE
MIHQSRTYFASARGVAACCAALITLSCGDGGAGGWGGSTTTLPGGAQLVSNPQQGIWTDATAWRVEEELRIGSSHGDGPDVFGAVFALDVADDGTFYIFDSLARELRVFSADGSYVRSHGRAGAGPGEFQGVVGVRVADGGDVWVVDMQNTRYTVYRGTEPTMYPRPPGMYSPPWIGGFTSDGVFHDVATTRDGELFLRVDADGSVLDTVHLATPQLRLPRRGSMTLPLPFAPRHLRSFDENGYVWTADTHEYRLHRITLAGDTVLVITHPQEAAPLGQAERDSVTRYARTLEAELRLTVDSDMIPRRAPLLDWIAVDETGSVWVGLAAADDDAPSVADVFAADGRYLGRLTLPFPTLGALPPRFRGGRLYTVSHDELGSAVIVRARVERPRG